MNRHPKRNRQYHVVEVKLKDKASGEIIDLGVAALIVQAGRYWWTRIYGPGGRRKGQWSLTPVELIRDASDGSLGG